jgi:predicted CopG family antitoxin
MEKNIKVDNEVWQKLQQEKLEEGYKKISDLIKTKITFMEKFNREKEFSDWFKEHFEMLGFSRIIEKRSLGFPDYIMELEGKEVGVELETMSSNFIRHHHDATKCDLVLCLVKDCELPIKIIDIPSFEYIKANRQTTSFRIESEVWLKFKIYCVENRLEYGEVLRDLILEKIKNGIYKQ